MAGSTPQGPALLGSRVGDRPSTNPRKQLHTSVLTVGRAIPVTTNDIKVPPILYHES